MLKAPGIVLTPPDNLKTNYLLPYFEAFPHTQLMIVWGSSLYDQVYDWAVAQGAGMRRDGILSVWSKDGSECFRAHGHAPAVFEYCDGYAEMKKNGWWRPEMLTNTYFNVGKPTYMQWDPKIFEENTEFCLRLGNHVGYHFVLQRAVLPKSCRRSAPFQVELEWLNDGVAYCYEPCHVALALLNRDGKILEKQWLEKSKPRSWVPNQAMTETHQVKFATTDAGSCQLAVGIFASQQDANPIYRLGIKGRTAEGWYVLQDKLEFTP